MKRDLVDELYKTAYKRYRENIQTKILYLYQTFQIHFGIELKVNLIEMDIMLQRNMSKKQS